MGEKMTDKEIAFEMFKREHQRWNQWALFFFGILATLFYAAGNENLQHLRCLIYLMGALVSAAWVCAAFAIRASTGIWQQMLRDNERREREPDSCAFGPFLLYERRIKKWNHLRKFFGAYSCRKFFFSVTRMLILIGGLIFLLCLAFFLQEIVNMWSWSPSIGWCLFGIIVSSVLSFLAGRNMNRKDQGEKEAGKS